MSRRDRDSRGRSRLYVAKISSRTRERDLDDMFSRYGRIRDILFRPDRDYAFIEFEDDRDASDAKRGLNGRDVDGSRIVVEFAHGPEDRAVKSKCFNCNLDGHWARDCPHGDWSKRCYRCGQEGHRQPECRNSPLRSRSRERLLRESGKGKGKGDRSRSPRKRSRERERSSKEKERAERGRDRSPRASDRDREERKDKDKGASADSKTETDKESGGASGDGKAAVGADSGAGAGAAGEGAEKIANGT